MYGRGVCSAPSSDCRLGTRDAKVRVATETSSFHCSASFSGYFILYWQDTGRHGLTTVDIDTPNKNAKRIKIKEVAFEEGKFYSRLSITTFVTINIYSADSCPLILTQPTYSGFRKIMVVTFV